MYWDDILFIASIETLSFWEVFWFFGHISGAQFNGRVEVYFCIEYYEIY